jgi:hypothetical protein
MPSPPPPSDRRRRLAWVALPDGSRGVTLAMSDRAVLLQRADEAAKRWEEKGSGASAVPLPPANAANAAAHPPFADAGAARESPPAIVWVRPCRRQGQESGGLQHQGSADWMGSAPSPVAAFYGAGSGAAAAAQAAAATAAKEQRAGQSHRRRGYVVQVEAGGATYTLTPLPTDGDGNRDERSFLSVASSTNTQPPWPSRRAAVAAAEAWIAAVDPDAWQLRARDAPWRELLVTPLQASALAAQGHAATAAFASTLAGGGGGAGGPSSSSLSAASSPPSSSSSGVINRGMAADAIDAQRMAQARAPTAPEAVFLAGQLSPWALARWSGAGASGAAHDAAAAADGRDDPQSASPGHKPLTPAVAAARLYAAAAAAALDAAVGQALLLREQQRPPQSSSSLQRCLAAACRAAVRAGGAGGADGLAAVEEDAEDGSSSSSNDEEEEEEEEEAELRGNTVLSSSLLTGPLNTAVAHAALPARLDAAANARRMWLAGLRPRLPGLWSSAHAGGFGWRQRWRGTNETAAPIPSPHDLFLDLMSGGYLWLRRVDLPEGDPARGGGDDEGSGGHDEARLLLLQQLLPPPLDPHARYEVTYQDSGGTHHVAVAGGASMMSAASAATTTPQQRPLSPQRSLVLPLPLALARAERLAQQMAADGAALLSRADVARCAAMAAGWKLEDAMWPAGSGAGQGASSSSAAASGGKSGGNGSSASPGLSESAALAGAAARAVSAPASQGALKELRGLGLPAVGLVERDDDWEGEEEEEREEDCDGGSGRGALPPWARYTALDAHRAATRRRRALGLLDPPATPSQIARMAELRLVPPPPASLLPPQARPGGGGGQVLPPPLTYPLARFLIYRWSQRGGVASAGGLTTGAESSSSSTAAAAADALRRSGLFAAPATSPRGRQWWETKRPRKR